jgi:hypothetical protein
MAAYREAVGTLGLLRQHLHVTLQHHPHPRLRHRPSPRLRSPRPGLPQHTRSLAAHILPANLPQHDDPSPRPRQTKPNLLTAHNHVAPSHRSTNLKSPSPPRQQAPSSHSSTSLPWPSRLHTSPPDARRTPSHGRSQSSATTRADSSTKLTK